jgi:acid phosphatase (class A)
MHCPARLIDAIMSFMATKHPGSEADLISPIPCRRNSTLSPVASLVYRSLPFVLLSLATLTASLRAEAQKYLPDGQPDAIALLAPPPLAGSAEQAADLAETVAVHNGCPPDDAAAARAEKKFTLFTFAPAIGSFFQPGKLPRTEAFFRRVQKETEAVADTAKNYWQRPRPDVVDPGLAASEEEMEKSFSYPSGHSTRATVYALLLAELFPQQQEHILALGRNIGWRRVEIARHYPTDIYAGRALAQAIVRGFKDSPAFQRDFAEVKAELAAAQHAGNTPADAAWRGAERR